MDDDSPVMIDRYNPESFLRKEFFVCLSHPYARDSSLSSISNTPSLSFLTSYFAKRVAEKIKGKFGNLPQPLLDLYEGSLLEIVERNPQNIAGYAWPDFNRLILNNNSRPALEVVKNKYRTFLFVPESSAEILGRVTLVGSLQEYDISRDVVGVLEDTAEIQYFTTPEFKTPYAHVGHLK